MRADASKLSARRPAFWVAGSSRPRDMHSLTLGRLRGRLAVTSLGPVVICLTFSLWPDTLLAQSPDSLGTQTQFDNALRHANELFASGKTRLASDSFRAILAQALQTHNVRGQAAAHL